MVVVGHSKRGSMSTAALLVCSVVILATCSVVPSAHAYTYHIPDLQEPAGDGSTSYHINEGPMFVTNDGPFGTSENSYVKLWGTATLTSGMSTLKTSVINLVFYNEFNADLVGVTFPTAAGKATVLCCTKDLVPHTCDRAGEAIIQGLNANTTAKPAQGSLPRLLPIRMTETVTEFEATNLVFFEGVQAAAIVVCDSASGDVEPVTVDLWVSFHNPYGFVPGAKYGLIPAYGVLSVIYGLLLLVFICLSICKRDKLIPLQFVVLGVIVMGAAETTTWFIAYLSKNSSGVGPCGVDGICPPLTADMMVALVLNVGKRTLSRVLLLVVVLGYGVVESTLGFARTGCVVLLGVLFFACGVAEAIVEVNSALPESNFWQVPLLILDLIFVAWIYHSLETTRRKLRDSNQTAKLSLYNSLACVLGSFVMLCIVYSVAVLAISFGFVPLPWKARWMLWSFWDVLYLGVLIAIAYIWMPGSRTQQYALYSQPTFNDAADAGDLEMPARARVGSEEEDDNEDVFAIGDSDGSDGIDGHGAHSKWQGGAGDGDGGAAATGDESGDQEGMRLRDHDEIEISFGGATAAEVAAAAMHDPDAFQLGGSDDGSEEEEEVAGRSFAPSPITDDGAAGGGGGGDDEQQGAAASPFGDDNDGSEEAAAVAAAPVGGEDSDGDDDDGMEDVAKAKQH